MRCISVSVLLGSLALLVCGCPSENYPNQLPATGAEINRIVQNNQLTSQEARTELVALGVDPVTINGLLQAQRLANQFGGDLRTAYTKITKPEFTSLTPDEVQVWGDEASALDPNDSLSVTLTDAEAQAIVTLFRDEGLTSSTALKDFLADPLSSVPSTIPDGVLQSLFVDFDPTRLLTKLP
jgi:hypothetical protein